MTPSFDPEQFRHGCPSALVCRGTASRTIVFPHSRPHEVPVWRHALLLNVPSTLTDPHDGPTQRGLLVPLPPSSICTPLWPFDAVIPYANITPLWRQASDSAIGIGSALAYKASCASISLAWHGVAPAKESSISPLRNWPSRNAGQTKIVWESWL